MSPVPLFANESYTYSWNGLNQAGEVVSSYDYRLALTPLPVNAVAVRYPSSLSVGMTIENSRIYYSYGQTASIAYTVNQSADVTLSLVPVGGGTPVPIYSASYLAGQELMGHP